MGEAKFGWPAIFSAGVNLRMRNQAHVFARYPSVSGNDKTTVSETKPPVAVYRGHEWKFERIGPEYWSSLVRE